MLVAGSIGLLLVAASTLALLPARETLIGPLLIVLGAGLLVAALNSDGADGVGAGANVVEALLAGAAGLLFARWLAAPVDRVSRYRCSSRRSTSCRWRSARRRGCSTTAPRAWTR